MFYLFEGISNFVGDLMPKPSFYKNSSDNIQSIACGENRIHTFSKGISPKVDVIKQLAFELANNSVAVQHFSYNATKTSHLLIEFVKNH